jgi:hypothetical protein
MGKALVSGAKLNVVAGTGGESKGNRLKSEGEISLALKRLPQLLGP